MSIRSEKQINQIIATLVEASRIMRQTQSLESHANAPLEEINNKAKQFLNGVKDQAIQAYKE